MTPNELLSIVIVGTIMVWLIASTVISNIIGLQSWWAKILLFPWFLVACLGQYFPSILMPVLWLVRPWADLAENIDLWFYNLHQQRVYKFRCKLHAGEQLYVPYRVPVVAPIGTTRPELNFSGWCTIVKTDEHWVTLEAYGREFQWTMQYLYDRVNK